MSKHTKGPWTLKNVRGDWVIDSDDIPFVDGSKQSIGWVHRETDAQLIAAAPELLETSEKFVAWFRDFIGDKAFLETIQSCPQLKDLFAAMKKARGEK